MPETMIDSPASRGRRAKGFYNVSEAAREVGAPRDSLLKWIAAGFVPAPANTFRAGRRLYYTLSDLAEIREFLKP